MGARMPMGMSLPLCASGSQTGTGHRGQLTAVYGQGKVSEAAVGLVQMLFVELSAKESEGVEERGAARISRQALHPRRLRSPRKWIHS